MTSTTAANSQRYSVRSYSMNNTVRCERLQGAIQSSFATWSFGYRSEANTKDEDRHVAPRQRPRDPGSALHQ